MFEGWENQIAFITFSIYFYSCIHGQYIHFYHHKLGQIFHKGTLNCQNVCLLGKKKSIGIFPISSTEEAFQMRAFPPFRSAPKEQQLFIFFLA